MRCDLRSSSVTNRWGPPRRGVFRGTIRISSPDVRLRLPGIWIGPLVITAVLIALIAVIYIGSVVNPTGHLHGLPVWSSTVTPVRPCTAGASTWETQIVDALQHASPVTSKLALTTTSLSAARRRWTPRRPTERW